VAGARSGTPAVDDDPWRRLAERAAEEVGAPADLLGGFLRDLDAAAAGAALELPQLDGYRSLGRSAAQRGVPLRNVVDLYLTAARAAWPRLTAVVGQSRVPPAGADRRAAAMSGVERGARGRRGAPVGRPVRVAGGRGRRPPLVPRPLRVPTGHLPAHADCAVFSRALDGNGLGPDQAGGGRACEWRRPGRGWTRTASVTRRARCTAGSPVATAPCAVSSSPALR
jgi:hypothetical protein